MKQTFLKVLATSSLMLGIASQGSATTLEASGKLKSVRAYSSQHSTFKHTLLTFKNSPVAGGECHSKFVYIPDHLDATDLMKQIALEAYLNDKRIIVEVSTLHVREEQDVCAITSIEFVR